MFSAPISGERTWETFDPPPKRAIGRDREDISICQYILFHGFYYCDACVCQNLIKKLMSI